MGFSKISKVYFCKIIISMEVQEVVMEVQEESLDFFVCCEPLDNYAWVHP